MSCKVFLYNLSKHLIVCLSFSYCDLYSLYLYMIISKSTLLPIDNPHVVAIDIDITIKPIPVRLKVIELDAVSIMTNVSNDFLFVVIVLYFLYFFFRIVVFIFEVGNHFFHVVN